MTPLRIVKTTFRKRNVNVLEYAICMTTLRIVKTSFRKHIVNVLGYAICMTTFRREIMISRK